MRQKDKLIKRLCARPKDFSFEELETLLSYFDYVCSNKGKTSGSRVIFRCNGHMPIQLDKPHNRKELLAYQVKQVIETLNKEGLL